KPFVGRPLIPRSRITLLFSFPSVNSARAVLSLDRVYVPINPLGAPLPLAVITTSSQHGAPSPKRLRFAKKCTSGRLLRPLSPNLSAPMPPAVHAIAAYGKISCKPLLPPWLP